jgi:hypothetical protein
MKKFTMIAIVLGVALMLAVPAMAVELTNDGYLRVRGFSEKGYSLDDNAQSTSSYYDMRFRLNTAFKVSDEVWINTRLHAMNRTLDGADPVDENNINWRRIWMNIKTPIGLFRAGRMQGGTWGLVAFDNEGRQDRIRLDGPAGPLKWGFIIRKAAEGDVGFTYSSADYNVYYAYILYPSETFTAGLLYGYLDNKTASDQSIVWNPATGTANNYSALAHLAIPFFKAKFGAFGLQGELVSVTGESRKWGSSVTLKDVDRDELAYNLEGQFNFGAGSAELGYMFASGQENKANADDTYRDNGLGDDWEYLFILAGSTGQTPGGIGGFGNMTATGGNNDGIKLIYGGASFKAGDAITLGVRAGMGKADEAATGQDDDLGFEIDLRFSWSFYDGSVKYSAVAAYLSAGDYWEGVTPPPNTTFDDSCYALGHTIQINF